MGVNIDMSGAKVTGEAKILNGVTVRGNSNVDINLGKTKFAGKAEILNDIDTKDMNLKINMEGTEIGEDVKFMNGEEVSKYKSNGRPESQRTQKTVQRTYNGQQKVVESNKEQQTKKKSLLRRLKEFFTGNMVKSDDVELIAVIEESAHKKFENEVSQNGRLKGCTDHVVKEKDYEKSNIEREAQTEEKIR